MTEEEIQQDAGDCMDLWARMFRAEGRNPSCIPHTEVWRDAYRCGVELGKEIEREECAILAESCPMKNVAAAIRHRTVLLDAEDADD